MKFLTQAAKVRNEQKKDKRRLAVFLCLAVIVALGTAAALKMYGQAMSHKDKRLICQVEAHQHTEQCYDGDKVICGYADYIVHTHNDDCYDGDGNLVCHLQEVPAHVHTDECYTEEKVLVCKEEEQAHQHTESCYTPEKGELQCQLEEHTHGEECYDSETGELTCQVEEHQHNDNCYAWEEVLTCPYAAESHQHSDECYTKEKGDLQCQIEEHTHAAECYNENNELICEKEEHIHNDDCYAWNDVLTCQLEETPAGHTHTDACYETKKVLTCGQLELHTHDENCLDENGALVCGLLELKEHTHQAECFETVELTDEEVAAKLEAEKLENSFQEGAEGEPEGETGSVSEDASVSGDEAGSVSDGDASVSGDKAASVSGDEIEIVSDNDADVHEHDETCYDAAGGLICGYEDLVEPTITQTYKDENEKYVVTASYKKDANIPEDAELKAEMITAESDEEHFARREAEMRETLQDENVKMDALFKIGFYADGKEVEPESEVMVTVQFLNEEGLADGTPMTIVHFGENGNEIIGGSHVKDKSTTFKTNGFSDFAALFRNILMAVQAEPTLSELDTDMTKEEGEKAETSSENSTASANSVSESSANLDKVNKNTVSGGENDLYGFTATASQNEETERQTKDIEEEITQSKRVIISGNYDYKGNGYDITFHVEGKASVSADNTENTPSANTTVSIDGETDPTDAGIGLEEGTVEDSSTEGLEGEETEESGFESGADTAADEEETGAEEGSGDGTEDVESDADEETESAPAGTDSEGGASGEETIIDDVTNEKLKFKVVNLGEDSEEHSTVIEHLEKQKETGEELVLDVLAYSMVYDGTEVDLADCTVSAVIHPEEETLKSYAEKSIKNSSDDSENEITVNVMEITDDSQVKELDSMKVSSGAEKKSMKVTMNSRTMSVRAIDEPNPNFTVQYYAWLDETIMGDGEVDKYIDKDKLNVINTESKQLPKNGVKPNLKNLTISQNGALKTERKLTEVYKARSCEYIKAPNLHYFDKLYKNGRYKLVQIWVLKDGKKADSMNEADWTVYSHTYENPQIHFTNKEDQEDLTKKILLIKDKAVIRLVYETTKSPFENDNVKFYDYDITEDGKTTAVESGPEKSDDQTGDVRKRGQGINNISNYDNNTSLPLFAFGNANSGTGLWSQRFGTENYLNKANPGGYAGCTFEIATGLDKNGKIQYRTDISVPKLFNDGTATGKEDINGRKLSFNRNGDSYILSAVSGNANLNENTENLWKFNHPTCAGITYDGSEYKTSTGETKRRNNIWTNSFWPMDNVTTGKDGKTGEYNSTGTHNGYSQDGNKYGVWKKNIGYPLSDDGAAHNNMFGMYFTIDFELTDDYIGPLNYLFFGDDDMWVFLSKLEYNEEKHVYDFAEEGDLICDIGGVHSSVGEYVNLWDYLKKGETNGKYRLSFFYTERGLSGSTCYMQFTLPSVSIFTPDQHTGNLMVKKKAVKVDNTGAETDFTTEDADNEKSYKFKIALSKTSEDVYDDYSYQKFGSNGKPIEGADGSGLIRVLSNGTEFELKRGQYIIVNYLPIGMAYEVIELEEGLDDYQTEINGVVKDKENRRISGTITTKGETVELNYKNKLRVYELPKTGGPGIHMVYAAVILLASSAALLKYRQIRRRREGIGR